ncbi:HK97 family phage prohead protease [Bacillus sp. S35]|nr:HK97 family phage prohead protease [Bacillus sp. S35]
MTDFNNKFELRFEDMNLKSNDEDKLTVSGYVNKTGQWSQTLGQRKKFVERILPGAFRKALENGNEIHFLAEHNNDKILSSTRNGSLTLREDENGLYMEAEISPTSYGRDYHTLIRDGIIKNMSFGMAVLKDSWDKLSDGTYQRSISDLALFEVSAVRSPAYVQSTIAARSIEVIEDVEIPEEKKAEQRELTFQEQLNVKRSLLKSREKMASWGTNAEIEKDIAQMRKEIREMEATLEKQKTATTTDNSNTQENRMVQSGTGVGPTMRQIDLVKANVKKMKGKHSLVARTNIIVAKPTEIDMFSEDGEFNKENMFVDTLTNLPLKDFTGSKVNIKGQRAGYGYEYSRQLINDNDVELQERSQIRLINKLEDGLNYSMLTAFGNMQNLNDDTSVSTIISTIEANKISLIDVLTLISKVNSEYREGASFEMHTDVHNHILTNPEFKDHITLATDEFSGKLLYHLGGYPMLINDNCLGANMTGARILFGNLGEGYTTLISEDSFNMLIINNDTESVSKASEKHIMDIYAGGKVTNKDCFVRLDVATVTQASESDSKEVENPTEEVSKETKTVEEKPATTQSESASVIEENPTDNVSNENETATEESVTTQSEVKSESAVVEKPKPQPKKTKLTKQTKPKV